MPVETVITPPRPANPRRISVTKTMFPPREVDVHPRPHPGQRIWLEPAWMTADPSRPDHSREAVVVSVGRCYFQACFASGQRGVRNFRLDTWLEHPRKGQRPTWLAHPDKLFWQSIGPRIDLARGVAGRCTSPPVLARDYDMAGLLALAAVLDNRLRLPGDPLPDGPVPGMPPVHGQEDPSRHDPAARAAAALAALRGQLEDAAAGWEQSARRLARENAPGWAVYSEAASALRRMLADPSTTIAQP